MRSWTQFALPVALETMTVEVPFDVVRSSVTVVGITRVGGVEVKVDVTVAGVKRPGTVWVT